MNKHTIAILGMLSLAGLLAAESGAQLVVGIPFTFELADRSLPAGEYHVWMNPQGVVWIKHAGLKTTVSLVSHAAHGNGAPVFGLTFNRYDDRHFLSKIWMGSDAGQELSKSRAEHEQVRARLVTNAKAPETVTVPARRVQPLHTLQD